MIDSKLATGQVRRVDFHYEDKPETSKERPAVVVVIKHDDKHVLLAKITTHGPRKEFKGEISLEDWEEAGLDHKSTVRCSKSIYAEASKVSSAPLIGFLSPRDLKEVEQGLHNAGFI